MVWQVAKVKFFRQNITRKKEMEMDFQHHLNFTSNEGFTPFKKPIMLYQLKSYATTLHINFASQTQTWRFVF